MTVQVPQTFRHPSLHTATSRSLASSSSDELTCAERLPPQPVPLIDRERETAAIGERLSQNDVRLLTVSGPGGVGKTAVALAVARALCGRFADGVAFVDLEPVRDPRALVPAIADALNLRERGDRSPRQLCDILQAREQLLVLDNVEHLIEAAPEVSALLASCPALKVLATSREPLGVRWEHEFPLAPLRLPCERGPLTRDSLMDVPSVALFMQRVRAIRPEFTLTEENAATIARICRRLDGLPLAIEIAAARMRTVSAPLLLSHIERRSDLLGARVPDAPRRHQTLGDLIGWSYDLLSACQQALLRRTAVFEGGCGREAADAMTGGDSCQFAAFVEKSLATAVDGTAGDTRICLLETVRSFALERLRELGEETPARHDHAEHMLRFVEEIARCVRRPGDGSDWRARLAAEEDNVRTALRWLVDQDDTERSMRLQTALATIRAAQAQSGVPPSTPGAPHCPLTTREREIAMLIAKGLTSRKMARALHISEKTVDSHVDHIRTKLDLGCRAEIAVWIVAQGLHRASD